MKFVIIAMTVVVVLTAAIVLLCCMRAGAVADEQMDRLMESAEKSLDTTDNL